MALALAVTAPPVDADEAEAVLGAGDVLAFDVVGDSEPQMELQIYDNGQVAVPMLGYVSVSGLTVVEAREVISSAFEEEGLLRDPAIYLAVARLRDVYVTGDVRTPGAFAYRPDFSVEQAVALAGGASILPESAGNLVLQRLDLMSQLDEIEAQFMRETTWDARLRARLEGRDRIAADDLPADARTGADQNLLDSFIAVENDIISARISGLAAQRDALSSEIKQIEEEIALLGRRADNQQGALDASREELARVQQLAERGLTTQNEVSAALRTIRAEEGSYLAIVSQLSEARSRLSGRQLELVRLDSVWRVETLDSLQERQLRIAELRERKRSLVQKISVIGALEAEQEGGIPAIERDFQIRRRLSDGTLGLSDAQSTDRLLPGDTLIVRLVPPQGDG